MDHAAFIQGILAGQRWKAWAAGAAWPDTGEADERPGGQNAAGAASDSDGSFLTGFVIGRVLTGWPRMLNDSNAGGSAWAGAFSVGSPYGFGGTGGLALPPPPAIAVASLEEASGGG